MAATASPSAGPGGASYAKLVQLRKGNGDPLGQTGPAGIDATINSVYPQPMSDSQIQGHAQMQVDPIIAALTGQIGDRAKQASDAISANSGALAKDLAATDWGAPYTQAKQEQAAVDAVLQGSLAGTGGTELAGDLRSRLGQIDDPAVAALAGEVGSRGAALGTTELARGSANLSNLIALAAAERSYGQKQPGIARLAGLQDIAGVERQAGTDIADARTKTLDMLPQIVASLRSSNDSTRGNRAQLLATLLGQNVSKGIAHAGLDKAANQVTYDTNQATAKASRPDPSLSRAYGYAVDANGNAITDKSGNPRVLPGYKVDPATGQVVKSGPAAGGEKPLSVAALRGLSSTAHDLYNGVSPHYHYVSGKPEPVPGTGTPPAHWNDAVAQLVAAGASHDQAVKLLTAQGWQPGEGGRPASAAQKKTAAAVKSGLGIPKTDPRFASLPTAPSPYNATHPGRYQPSDTPAPPKRGR